MKAVGCRAITQGTASANSKVLMTSGDLENNSRSTKLNTVLALPKVNINMKYECYAIKTPVCRAITRVIQTDRGRDRERKGGTDIYYYYTHDVM